jgi:hypothetical protein
MTPAPNGPCALQIRPAVSDETEFPALTGTVRYYFQSSGVASRMYLRSLGLLSPLAQGIVRESVDHDRTGTKMDSPGV